MCSLCVDVWNLAASSTNDLDSDLVGEDDLLSKDRVDLVKKPVECGPGAGPTKKACKNCSCGLAEQQAAEEAGTVSTKPISACGSVRTKTISRIYEKAPSCGNNRSHSLSLSFPLSSPLQCGLGDAFRCASCPYLGQPAFATSATGAVKLAL